jgi:regulatory protein
MDSLKRSGQTHLTPLQYAYRLLARRAYNQKELGERLEGTGFTSKAVAQVIARLKAQGYVNDVSLACEQVERLKEKGYGRRYMQRKLVQRGFAAPLIDQVIKAAVSAEEEVEAARRLLQRRFGGGGPKDRKAQERAFRFLVSRGYSIDLAANLVDNGEEWPEDGKEL